jgi:hypothetical protein
MRYISSDLGTETSIIFPEGFSTIIDAKGSSEEFKDVLRKANVKLYEDVTFDSYGKVIVNDAKWTTQLLKNATSIDKVKCEGGVFTAIIDGKYKIAITTENDIIDFGKCENLEEIRIENAPGVKTILLPQSNNKLKSVNLHSCCDINELDISRFSNLENVTLFDCDKPNELKLPLVNVNLKNLKIIGNEKLEKIDVSNFVNLAKIDLSCLKELNELKIPSAGNNLREFHISGCGKIEKIDASKCEHVERVEVSGTTTIIAPNHFHCVIDADGSSRAVMQALQNAGAELK